MIFCRRISISHLVLLYAIIIYVLFSSTTIVCPLDKEVTRELFTTSRPVKFMVRYIFSYCDGRFNETIISSPEFTDEMRDGWMRANPTQIFHHTIWGWYSGINNERFAISAGVLVPISMVIFSVFGLMIDNPPVRWY